MAGFFEPNIVVPDTFTGKLSTKLYDINLAADFRRGALADWLHLHLKRETSSMIISSEPLKQKMVTTETSIFGNANIADIKPTVDGLVDAASGGKILIDARSNSLVISERSLRLNPDPQNYRKNRQSYRSGGDRVETHRGV